MSSTLSSRWLAFVAGFLLVLPVSAQMRSSISAGPVGRPLPPSGLNGPRFGNHFHRGNRFGGGAVIYPYGFYDDYYDNRSSAVSEQPAPVVVVREEQPAVVAAAPALPPADPKIIEVPEASNRVAKSATPSIAAIFILSDGRRIESQNYTVTDSILTIKESHRPSQQIPLSQLNVDATLAANRERGLDLQLPESRSEILISF
jgi:hypothetical protein